MAGINDEDIGKICTFIGTYESRIANRINKSQAIIDAVESSGVDANLAYEFAISHGIDPNDPCLENIKQSIASIQETNKRAKAEAIAKEGKVTIKGILDSTSIDSTEVIRRIKDTSIDIIAKTSSIIEAFNPEPSWDDIVKRYITKSEGYRPDILEGLIFPYGTISYIGARTSRGKTTAMVSLAIDALKQHRRVIFVTLEEPIPKIHRKLIMCQAYLKANEHDREALLAEKHNPYSSKEGTPVTAYNALLDIWANNSTPNVSPFNSGLIFPEAITSAWEYIRKRYNDKRLSIYDATVHCNRNSIRDRLLKANEGDIVLFDYIQRTHGAEGEETDTDIMRIRKASDMLIEVSQARKCIVIAGAQFNRSSTGTNSGKETKDDTFSESSFKDCGDIEQDATIAIGIGWNKDRNGHVDSDNRFYEVLKNREGGGVGKRFDLNFRGAYSYMASKGERSKQADGGGDSRVKTMKADSETPTVKASHNYKPRHLK